MKHSPIPALLICLLLCFLLLFPATPYGDRLFDSVFPDGNRDEASMIPQAQESEDKPPSSAPTFLPADFFSSVREELPGRYDLISLYTLSEEFSDEMLTSLRQLGIPMVLILNSDGTAFLHIFDQAASLDLDTDHMMISMSGRTLPFYYSEGIIRIQDGDEFMIFRRELP